MSAAAFLLALIAAALIYVTTLINTHAIAVVHARGLLPAWDLASHLYQGWLDYYLLATGQIARLAGDVWRQGYWPPAPSLYQVPFYLVLGGGITSGLWSGLAAFVLTAVTGSALLWHERHQTAVLPASVFVALLISSPFLLAYASLAMTETLGALAELLVLFCYARYRRTQDARTARLFAVSLTLLFFTKYNYFLLLAAPLVLHEWLERTAGWSAARRMQGIVRCGRRAISTPTGAAAVLYVAAVLVILAAGGFETHILGYRLSFRTVGYSGQLALYLLLARLWYCHRRRRIDWAAVTGADPRVRPLLIWFVLPVTIWLASPYPNHFRDFVNLVFNRELGEQGAAGIVAYIDALRTAYLYSQWILAFVLVAMGAAAIRYRQQAPVIQVILLAIGLQFAAIALHHTRSPRFLLPTVVLLCLAVSSEVGRWFDTSRRARLVAVPSAALVILAGAVAATAVVGEERFRAIAFEPYTDSESLRNALQSIRRELNADDRLVLIGQGNRLSPALFKWELGPPSGVPCAPYEAGGSQRLDFAFATRVLLLTPAGTGQDTTLDITSSYVVRQRAFLDMVEAGAFVLRDERLLTDMGVALRLYDRTSRPVQFVACE